MNILAASTAIDNQGNQDRSVSYLKHGRLKNEDESTSFLFKSTTPHTFMGVGTHPTMFQTRMPLTSATSLVRFFTRIFQNE